MIAVLTSTHARHKAFAKKMCENFDVSLVVFEKKHQSSELSSREKEYFKKLKNWLPDCRYVFCNKGEINSLKVQNSIKQVSPLLGLVFGTSILKPNLYNIPNLGCFNIHTGKTQYFRGVDSAFWAIHDEKLEGIGATIHKIDQGIDTGIVYAQASPLIIEGDDHVSLFLKSCQVGFESMAEKVFRIIEGDAKPLDISSNGKIYFSKDKNSEKEKEVTAKTKKVIKDFLNV